MKEITLYYTQGGSDKVYQLRLIKSGDEGFHITYANAKRGRALNHKVKNSSPLTLSEAQNEFDKIVKGKAKTGYTTNVDGILFSGIDLDGSSVESSSISSVNTEHSGFSPQLLSEVTYEQALRLCNDRRYVAQQKHDGERRPLERNKNVIRGINKKGFFTTPAPTILQSAMAIKADSYLIDGEDMGQMLWAFDLLELNGQDIRLKPYKERFSLLKKLIGDKEHIKVVHTAFSVNDKFDLMGRVQGKNLEGIVLKRKDEAYSAGKGSDQFKYKFFDEASVIVESISSTKRSVGVAVMDKGKMVPVGKVTVPPNKVVPDVGSVIDVKYLYFTGSALFTTSYLKPRLDDVAPSECLISRLKLKAEDCAA